MGLRLLGPETKRLTQDLKSWAPKCLVLEVKSNVREDLGSKRRPDGSEETNACEEDNNNNNADANNTSSHNTRVKYIEKTRVVGHCDSFMNGFCNKSTRTISIIDGKPSPTLDDVANAPVADGDVASKSEDHSNFAIETSDPLEVFYAKDLLFSFLCSAAKTLKRPNPGEAMLRLSNTKIDHASD